MGRIAFLASEEHFRDHLLPIYDALPAQARSRWYGMEHGYRGVPESHVVVASYGDLKRSRFYMPHAQRTLVQHGAGQSYYGVQRTAGHPSYSGGVDHRDVSLFLCPNEFSARKWRGSYPAAKVEVVGSPRLDALPPRDMRLTGVPTIAVSFHWHCGLVDETKSAFPQFRGALTELKAVWNVVAHAHPRAKRMVEHVATRAKVPFLPAFADVCAQADVYVCDNSSTIFEFAALGRPVVLMNPRHYRKDVNHGMRFWELATIGPNAHDVAELAGAVRLALDDPPELRKERTRVVDLVYPVRQAAPRAATALLEWAQ